MKNEFLVSENDAEQRLDRFLRKTFPTIPLGSLHRFIREKKLGLFRNGKREKFSRGTPLVKGDHIRIFFPLESFPTVLEKKLPDMRSVLRNPFFKGVKIILEDPDLLVVDKPAGIPVHPGTNVRWEKSLFAFCSAHIRS